MGGVRVAVAGRAFHRTEALDALDGAICGDPGSGLAAEAAELAERGGGVLRCVHVSSIELFGAFLNGPFGPSLSGLRSKHDDLLEQRIDTVDLTSGGCVAGMYGA